MPEPIDILREAREYYREHGGAKGTTTDIHGKVCALGAWVKVGRQHYTDARGLRIVPEMATAQDALRATCRELHGYANVAGFNDSQDDPYPVIMDLYDHAIKNMENGENENA